MTDFDAKRDLRGIIASLHTPFDAKGEMDGESLERLVDHASGSGCRGVLVAAVAGEVSSLTPDERSMMLNIVKEASGGRLRIIAGVSAADAETSIGLAREAADIGCDMALWQPPPDLDVQAIEETIRRIGDALPVMLQDLDWQGNGMDAAAIAAMADRVPALQAVKIETVPAGPKYSAVAEASGGRLHLSGGWAAMQMMDGLARGLDAFVPSGILPVYVRIFNLWSKGRKAEARDLFEESLPILAFSNQHIQVSIRFWKYVRLIQAIFKSDTSRPPIGPLDDIQMREAARLAKRAVSLEANI